MRPSSVTWSDTTAAPRLSWTSGFISTLFVADPNTCKNPFVSFLQINLTIPSPDYYKGPTIDTTIYHPGGGWDLNNATYRCRVVKYDCCPESWTDVTLIFDISRRGSSFVWVGKERKPPLTLHGFGSTSAWKDKQVAHRSVQNNVKPEKSAQCPCQIIDASLMGIEFSAEVHGILEHPTISQIPMQQLCAEADLWVCL